MQILAGHIAHIVCEKFPSKPGKRETTTPEVGQGLAGEMQASYQCNGCGNTKTMWRCSCCKLVIYCGINCQKKYWSEHKMLCNEIKQEIKAKNQNSHDETHSDIFVSHLTPKQQQKVVSLIGKLNQMCAFAMSEIYWTAI